MRWTGEKEDEERDKRWRKTRPSGCEDKGRQIAIPAARMGAMINLLYSGDHAGRGKWVGALHGWDADGSRRGRCGSCRRTVPDYGEESGDKLRKAKPPSSFNLTSTTCST